MIRLITILGIVMFGAGGFLFFGNDFKVNVVEKNNTEASQESEVLLPIEVSEAPAPPPPLDFPVIFEKPKNKEADREKPQVQVILPFNPETSCSGAIFEQLQCYRGYYQMLLQRSGAKVAMNDLRSRHSDPFIKSQCHQLAHVVGREAALFYPNVSEAFRYGDSFCWSGYYHGVMEGIVGDVGKKNLAKKLDFICIDIPGKESFSFDYYNCVHGLGHGIMGVSNNELFSSLEMCDNLTGGWERSSCWSGAFMENIIADEVYHVSKYLSADPLYPCSAAADKYKNTCYLMQTSRMLALVGRDFAKVFELCGSVEEPYINTCYQSLGRDASGNTVSDVEKTRSYCMLGKDTRQRSHCIIGAVKDFISYHHSDIQARTLCVSLPEELQEVCNNTAAGYYKLF